MTRKIISVPVVLLITISAFGYFLLHNPKPGSDSGKQTLAVVENKTVTNRETLARIKQKSLLAKDYIRAHEYNNNTCFLIDMGLPSGKNRFFVYDLNADSVELAGLVTHGSGSEGESDGLVFSNTPNSYCTSLGKYKIGNGYNGRFGLAYKLYGLDKTNSKAFDRFVVLHAHECVPNDETAPLSICLSQGCPTVSPAFLKQLKTYLDQSEKPILLWIYY